MERPAEGEGTLCKGRSVLLQLFRALVGGGGGGSGIKWKHVWSQALFGKEAKTQNSFKSAGGAEPKALPSGRVSVALPGQSLLRGSPPPTRLPHSSTQRWEQDWGSLGLRLAPGRLWGEATPLQSTKTGELRAGPGGQGQGPCGVGAGGQVGPGAQKLLKISRFRFQSICGALLFTRVALAFSLASAAVGLKCRPLS